MSTPGAETSTQVPKEEKEAFLSKLSVAATDMVVSLVLAFRKSAVWLLLLPADLAIKIPAETAFCKAVCRALRLEEPQLQLSAQTLAVWLGLLLTAAA